MTNTTPSSSFPTDSPASLSLKVTLEEALVVLPANLRSFPGNSKFWNCVIEHDGNTMKTQFVTRGDKNLSEDEALTIIGEECRIADTFNTLEDFRTAFGVLYSDLDLLRQSFDEIQDMAANFKKVLGPELYSFYTLDTSTAEVN